MASEGKSHPSPFSLRVTFEVRRTYARERDQFEQDIDARAKTEREVILEYPAHGSGATRREERLRDQDGPSLDMGV